MICGPGAMTSGKVLSSEPHSWLKTPVPFISGLFTPCDGNRPRFILKLSRLNPT